MKKMILFDPVNNDPQFIRLIYNILNGQIDLLCIINHRHGFNHRKNAKVTRFLPYVLSSKIQQGGFIKKFVLAGVYLLSSFRALGIVILRRCPVIFSSGLWLPIVDSTVLRIMKIFGINFHVLVHNPSKVAKTFTSFLTYYYSPNYRYIVLSNFAKKQLIRKYRISSDRIEVMAHPNFNIEYDSFDVDRSIRDNLIEWKKERSLFLYMSGLSKNHGILDFVKLVEESIRRELPYCFLICGNPRNSKQIAISENIEARFCGTKTVKCSLGFYSVKAAKTWLSIANAVILPYQGISQSGVQALAQGQGTPVVVHDTGGLKEQIIDGFNGILVRDTSLVCWLEALNRVHRIEFNRYDIRAYSERQCGVRPTIKFFRSILCPT